MKELLNKTIKQVMVSDDDHILKFICDDCEIYYVAEGECCSESWFADIVGYHALINVTVTSVEEVEVKYAEDERTRQDYDTIYGYKLKTTKGYADIVFRNSSNGYYGGCADAYLSSDLDDSSYILESKFLKITDDWSA